MCDCILIHKLLTVVWPDGQELEHDWKTGNKDSCGSMWIDFSIWAKDVKIFVANVNAHQNVISMEEDFNNHVNKMTHLVDRGQSLHPCLCPIVLAIDWPYCQGWRLGIGSPKWTLTH